MLASGFLCFGSGLYSLHKLESVKTEKLFKLQILKQKMVGFLAGESASYTDSDLSVFADLYRLSIYR